MEQAVYTFLLGVAQAALLWLALMALVSTVALTLSRRADRRSGEIPGRRSRTSLGRRGPADVPPEDVRYATEVAVAAERAAEMARRRRADWLTAQEVLERSWAAVETAAARLERLTATHAFPTPATPRLPAEYAERERYLHRAAVAAYWRGELAAATVIDALSNRNGWDPRLHPADQELVLRRAVHADLLAAYRSAVERERAAWRDAGTALAAARSLRAEAYSAAERARQRLPARGHAPARPADRPIRRRSLIGGAAVQGS